MENSESSRENDNPYLALREAKIARNEARLKELGLWNTTSGQSKKRNTKLVSDRMDGNGAGAKNHPNMSLRRSSRLGTSKTINYDEPYIVPTSLLRKTKRTRVGRDQTRDNGGVIPKTTTHVIERAPPPPPPNSVRAISIDPERLVLGSLTDGSPIVDGVLGRSMAQSGKEFVIYQSFDLAALPDNHDRLDANRVGGPTLRRLSFNKYSGVQEWANAIFLWVNLGGGGGGDNVVVNEFREDGKQITWFGGSRMDETTPVIQKLIQWGQEATDEKSRLILWCRGYDRQRKAFGPYVCLGRLSYHSHQSGSYPLAFVWNLLDSDRIKNHKNDEVQAMFRQFVDK